MIDNAFSTRFKGISEFLTHGDESHKIEVIRYMKPDRQPGIKVGVLFRKTPFGSIINRMFQDEKMLQATWVHPENTGTSRFYNLLHSFFIRIMFIRIFRLRISLFLRIL